MTEPIFWLGLSLLLVAVCLTAVLVAAIPALQELARASRSAEKLFDTLYRELPPTLESIRLTGLEITELTDEIGGGFESAGNVARQVDQGLQTVQKQVRSASVTTRSAATGLKAAWKSFTHSTRKRTRQHSQGDRLPPSRRPTVQPTSQWPEPGRSPDSVPRPDNSAYYSRPDNQDLSPSSDIDPAQPQPLAPPLED